MRAALCKSLDGPSALVVEDVPEPSAAPGTVVIRVRHAALNFFDTLITRGKYQQKPELPFSPSGEVAGLVEALGAGVTRFQIGQHVSAYVGWGGAREKVVVPAERVVAVPDGVSGEVASGVAVTYGTAIHGLRDRGALKPGETLAVLGASGGAGLAAIEIGKLLGARVIAVASSPEKLSVCREHGADDVIDYEREDLKESLRALSGGTGIDVVYDCVGGPYAEPAVRALGWQGRFLVVGFAAGDIPRIPLNLLLLKGADLIGVSWGQSVQRDPAGHRRNVADVLKWIADGRLSPRIHGTYPLDNIVEALSVIDSRSAVGKVVLTI